MGYKMIGVCEMMEMAEVKSFGAEMCFDVSPSPPLLFSSRADSFFLLCNQCNDVELVDKVLKATQNSLSMAMDCSSMVSSRLTRSSLQPSRRVRSN